MSRRDADSQTHSKQLNNRVEDGGGCTETWSALSEMRNSGIRRRDVLTHVGLTLGAITAGSSVLSGSATAVADNDVDKTPVRGRERAQLLKRANTSSKVDEVADILGETPEATAAFEYDNGEETGYGVTFGTPGEQGTTITYYESDAIKGGSTAKGGTPVGDGVRGANAGPTTVTFDFGTSLVQNVARAVPDDAVDAATADGDLARRQSILVRGRNRFDIYVPVTRNDEFVGRVVMTSDVAPATVTSADLSVAPKRNDDGISTQNHVICGPWGTVCTNYCTVLCSALAGLSGAACTSACSGTIVGIPISPACGAICAGVVGGTCYPTCTGLTGH
ncbi:hypothetical protein [Haladaptatus sp. DYF46]|uniref:hypothetical protein n=1 Tax=Haladaptatus sp. DYF46 TaxID=2886041 RepID=UPI001E4E1607|nr:hypothetical protein [Haladaptatus sp. DYF46]